MKTKFIYIIGIEGCGHHGFMPIVENIISSSLNDEANLYSRWGELRKAFDRIWLAKNPLINMRGKFQLNRLFVRLHTKKSIRDDAVYILEDRSFPSKDRRTPDQGWNLYELYERVRRHSEVYLIVLNRDPIAATFSHKDWDGGLKGHAEVIAQHLDYLSATMKAIGVSNFRSISYEELSTNRVQVVEGIVSYLGLRNADVKKAFKDFRQSKKNWQISLDEEDIKWIQSFFDDERSNGWKVLTDQKCSLLGTQRKTEEGVRPQ